MHRVLFLFLFVGGLALAVYAMLHGVERPEKGRARPSPFFNAPAAAAFFAATGATGYLIATRTTLSPLLTLAAAIATGGAAMGGVVGLLAGWALRKGKSSAKEDEELQGQIARVTDAITPQSPGEIAYTLFGKLCRAAARSVDGSSIEAGAEVVIESMENGVARVELWSAVEQRL